MYNNLKTLVCREFAENDFSRKLNCGKMYLTGFQGKVNNKNCETSFLRGTLRFNGKYFYFRYRLRENSMNPEIYTLRDCLEGLCGLNKGLKTRAKNNLFFQWKMIPGWLFSFEGENRQQSN